MRNVGFQHFNTLHYCHHWRLFGFLEDLEMRREERTLPAPALTLLFRHMQRTSSYPTNLIISDQISTNSSVHTACVNRLNPPAGPAGYVSSPSILLFSSLSARQDCAKSNTINLPPPGEHQRHQTPTASIDTVCKHSRSGERNPVACGWKWGPRYSDTAARIAVGALIPCNPPPHHLHHSTAADLLQRLVKWRLEY